MKFESLAPDLQTWFRDMVKRGQLLNGPPGVRLPPPEDEYPTMGLQH